LNAVYENPVARASKNLGAVGDIAEDNPKKLVTKY
jgi:hypothetical protein